jgi:PD-(D/E)XK nuclease superfamily
MDTVNSGIDTETERVLTRFVMECSELRELEALLSRFNIFRVLRAAKHEIRHSNMLAWLLTPDESHGLDDRFFRRWLMHVVHNADDDTKGRLHLPSPIEIDALDIESVEVTRERESIDLLVVVRTIRGASWTICIENKVESSQHSNQLRRYREIVERRYHDVEYRLFVFLTKNEEEPDDMEFITSSYAGIENVLRMCIDERGDSIGLEPRLLMTQYLKLLEEDFVEENKAAELARKIYRSHRKAIDFILENRSDPISEATGVMKEFLTAHSGELGIIIDVQNKGYVRFLPKVWDVPQNTGGTAWGPNSRIVLCEISFWTKNAELHIAVGDAPDAWADKVWERAATKPFKQEWKKRPTRYVKPFKARSDIAVAKFQDADPDVVQTNLGEWITKELQSERFREAVDVMRALMEELPVKAQ